MRVRCRALFPGLILVCSFAWGMERRLLLAGGRPAVGSQVSIPGVSGSARADQHGRFLIGKRVEPPFTLVVIGARGEIYPPVIVDELPASGVLDIHLESFLHEF